MVVENFQEVHLILKSSLNNKVSNSRTNKNLAEFAEPTGSDDINSLSIVPNSFLVQINQHAKTHINTSRIILVHSFVHLFYDVLKT